MKPTTRTFSDANRLTGIQYEPRNPKGTIIFSPAISSDVNDYRYFFEALGRRIIAYNHPGHAGSTGRLHSQGGRYFVEAHENAEEPVAYIGHSIGASFALNAAAEMEQRGKPPTSIVALAPYAGEEFLKPGLQKLVRLASALKAVDRVAQLLYPLRHVTGINMREPLHAYDAMRHIRPSQTSVPLLTFIPDRDEFIRSESPDEHRRLRAHLGGEDASELVQGHDHCLNEPGWNALHPFFKPDRDKRDIIERIDGFLSRSSS